MLELSEKKKTKQKAEYCLTQGNHLCFWYFMSASVKKKKKKKFFSALLFVKPFLDLKAARWTRNHEAKIF